MTEPAVRQLAQQLMAEHGLIDKGWTFDLDRAIRRRGCCHHYQKKITVSRPLALVNEETKVRNTLLHEIAHALLPSSEGHSKKWKALHISIGGTGERCSTGWTEPAEATRRSYTRKRYEGICPSCNHKYTRYQRRNIACGYCCKQFNGGKYDERFKIEFHEVGEVRTYTFPDLKVENGLLVPTGGLNLNIAVTADEEEKRTCRVCGHTRPRSEFSPDLHSKSTQCKNCSYFRSHLYQQGVTPCPNEIIKMMVDAVEGEPA